MRGMGGQELDRHAAVEPGPADGQRPRPTTIEGIAGPAADRATRPADPARDLSEPIAIADQLVSRSGMMWPRAPGPGGAAG